MAEIPADIANLARFVLQGHAIAVDFGSERKERLFEDIARALLDERAEARRKTLEEAAQVADASVTATDWALDDLCDLSASSCARRIAAGIRALGEEGMG